MRLGDQEKDPYLKEDNPDLHPFMLVEYSRTNNDMGTPIARDLTCLYFTGFIKCITPNCAFVGGDFSITTTSDGRQQSVRTLSLAWMLSWARKSSMLLVVYRRATRLDSQLRLTRDDVLALRRSC